MISSKQVARYHPLAFEGLFLRVALWLTGRHHWKPEEPIFEYEDRAGGRERGGVIFYLSLRSHIGIQTCQRF